MSISYSKKGDYGRYQVRIMRHGKAYSRCFSCREGKKAALQKAKAYEASLLELLGAQPMTMAGRKRNSQMFKPNVVTDGRWGTQYVIVRYRRADGVWKQVSKAVGPHGLAKATKLAVEMAKERHCPAEKVVKAKLPSKQAVKELLG